ncbi:hypothetical protein Misp01_37920 [Microtetraspora sp. NBRC 13810]|uniref:hypothetical protein n=1 Tax=Microtetraspora sp. NBRC 13810 TaxID=3030990 RepID=UPI0024A206BF|nr:hypothetical protein [Microtetraspora sp. NBRC 13810]GLW08662.1 hypothetical protein Misp01_37920 [Microtetraspora sp. NBRC 13810]
MRFSFGSRRPPADIRIEPGDRVLAHAATGDGEHVVATDRALYLPGGTRLPWERIDRGTWDEEGLRVTTTDGATYTARLTEPGRLPETVRERVTASIVVTQYVTLSRGGGVRLVARRPPAGGGDLTWEFVFDEGLDPADPGLRAHAEQALEAVRRNYGV